MPLINSPAVGCKCRGVPAEIFSWRTGRVTANCQRGPRLNFNLQVTSTRYSASGLRTVILEHLHFNCFITINNRLLSLSTPCHSIPLTLRLAFGLLIDPEMQLNRLSAASSHPDSEHYNNGNTVACGPYKWDF